MIEESDFAILRRHAALYMALFGVFWAINLEIADFLPPGHSIYEILWWRYALHVLFTVICIAPKRGISLVRSQHPAVQITRGLLMVLTSVGAVRSTSGMSIDDLRAVLWLAPLLVIALDRVLRRTPCPAAIWTACISCWVGTMIVLKPHLGRDFKSMFWAILTVVSFAGYQMLTVNLRTDPATTSVFYSGLVVFLAMSVILPRVWRVPSGQAVLIFFAMGLAGWMCLLFLDKALHAMEPGAVTIYGYFHIVTDVVLRALINGTVPRQNAIFGSLLILGAAAFAMVSVQRYGKVHLR
jgi:drug/metabolite transporter (DMT)-like permease